MTQFGNNNCADNTKLRSLRGWFKRTPIHNFSKSVYFSDSYENSKCFLVNSSILTYKEECVQRNTFEHWKVYVVHKLERRKEMCLADNLYRTRLKRKTLTTFLTNSLLQRCRSNHETALQNDTIRNNILLKSHFVFWTKFVRHEQIVRIKKAQWLGENRRLRHCIKTWKAFVLTGQDAKFVQHQMRKASEHYATTLLRKSMNSWLRIYLDIRKRSDMASMIHKRQILKRYYNTWTKFHETKQTNSYVRGKARRHFEEKLLRHCLKKLIMHVTLTNAERILLQEATEFCRRKRLEEAFLLWRDWYRRKEKNRAKHETICRIFDARTLRESFLHWQSYVLHKKCRMRKLFLARHLHEKRLKIMGFKGLRSYLRYRKEKKIRLLSLNVGRASVTLEIQRIFIRKWREKLRGVMQEKRRIHQAVEFREIRLVRRHFSRWIMFSEQYKIKIAKKQELQELARIFMIKRYLPAWVAKCKEALMLKEKEVNVVCILKRKTARKYFSCWMSYVKRRKEKRSGIEAAKEIHNKFILRAGLKQILRTSLYRIELSEQNQLTHATAMSLERFKTLKKYFDIWLMQIRTRLGFKNSSVNKRLAVPANIFKSTNLVLPEYMMNQRRYLEVFNNLTL